MIFDTFRFVHVFYVRALSPALSETAGHARPTTTPRENSRCKNDWRKARGSGFRRLFLEFGNWTALQLHTALIGGLIKNLVELRLDRAAADW